MADFYQAPMMPAIVTDTAAMPWGAGARLLLVKGRRATQSHEEHLRAALGQAVVTVVDQLEGGCGPLDRYDGVISLGGGHVINEVKQKLGAEILVHVACPVNLVGAQAAMNAFDLAQNRQQGQPHFVYICPDFFLELPRTEIVHSGLGVLIDLTESYCRLDADHPVVDPLIWSGLEAFVQGFVRALEGENGGRMALIHAALMAGAGIGFKGFGLTHQCAMQLRQVDQPYGRVKASLVAEVIDMQCRTLEERIPDHPALERFAMVGEALAGRPFDVREEAFASLIGTLRRWVSRLEVEKLAASPQQVHQAVKAVTQDAGQGQSWRQDDLSAALLRRCIAK